jgi:hypothetical protein
MPNQQLKIWLNNCFGMLLLPPRKTHHDATLKEPANATQSG